ncbi:unnamed protein product [Trichogramma brassicae]|uniref:BHLH domain-containing protein n=1 Tax=Trichogramma brassicae TaxID=86971 RepID=A0A6H5HZ84_9HYME|nr:unnamed protein product [Trichogramma brassicae]
MHRRDLRKVRDANKFLSRRLRIAEILIPRCKGSSIMGHSICRGNHRRTSPSIRKSSHHHQMASIVKRKSESDNILLSLNTTCENRLIARTRHRRVNEIEKTLPTCRNEASYNRKLQIKFFDAAQLQLICETSFWPGPTRIYPLYRSKSPKSNHRLGPRIYRKLCDGFEYEFLNQTSFLFSQQNLNVIVVDWSSGCSAFVPYTQAAANTKYAALQIKEYAYKIYTEKFGIKLHFITQAHTRRARARRARTVMRQIPPIPIHLDPMIINMSTTMGIPVVFGNNNNNNNNGEQLMLLRTLQDNEHNIIGNNNRVVVTTTTATSQPANNNSSPKSGNVSVIQSQQKSSEKSNNNGKRKIVVDEPLPPYDPARLKKHGKNGQPPPIAVAKRNARERNRVKQVNNGFATLRQHIPSQLAQGYGDRGKKLSKVETLRMAVEYIRGLQRLLAEADGLDPNQQQQQLMSIEQSAQQIMIPSPCGSVYSQNGGQHNGSAEQLLGLDESQQQQQQQHGLGELEDNSGLDDGAGPDAYGSLMEDEDELDARRDVKRFKLDAPIQNRLSDNNGQQKVIFRRNRLASADTATSVLYLSKQSFIVGDEENIEPLPNRNNNNNNLLPAFSTSLLLPQQQQQHQILTSHVKRELRLDDEDEEDELRSNEDDSGIMLTTSTSPYSATEILVENPETGRLVPLKIEAHHQQHQQLLEQHQQQQQHHHQHETAAQLVYVEGLPAAAYYRHELEAVANGSELMDAVNWWEPVDHHQNNSSNTSTTRGLGQLPNPQQHHHHRLAHRERIVCARRKRSSGRFAPCVTGSFELCSSSFHPAGTCVYRRIGRWLLFFFSTQVRLTIIRAANDRYTEFSLRTSDLCVLRVCYWDLKTHMPGSARCSAATITSVSEKERVERAAIPNGTLKAMPVNATTCGEYPKERERESFTSDCASASVRKCCPFFYCIYSDEYRCVYKKSQNGRGADHIVILPFVAILASSNCRRSFDGYTLLHGKFANRETRQQTSRYFAPWLGEGLLISTGEKWRSHRKIIAPTFHLNVLKSFVPLFFENSIDLVNRLKNEVGKEFDCHDYMSSVTVDILLETAMGVRGTQKEKSSFDYAVAVMKMCNIIHQRQYNFLLRLDSMFQFTAFAKKQKQYLDTIHGLTKRVIKKRKAEVTETKEDSKTMQEIVKDMRDQKEENTNDSFSKMKYVRDDLDEIDENDIGEKRRLAFLDLMLELRKNGAQMTDEEIKEEVDTIMFEGHDTTAAGSSFVLCVLGAHQDVQARVMDELNEIFKGSDRPCTFQDTLEMKYLERVILETLRLFPPVPAIARKINEDVHLASGDYIVPAGSTVVIPQWKTHRLAEHYPNPLKFDPDNFLPDRTQDRHYYAYIPFSAGPRSCVGRKYAMLKLKILLSTVLRNYKVTSDLKEEDYKLQVDIILKRSDGFRIKIEPRNETLVA